MSEGIKYDQDKLRLAEMIIDFAPELQELCKVWTFGANKYSKSNWKLVENGYERYSNALIRHLIAEEKYWYDNESDLLHAAHIAFNALARMHFIFQDKLHKVNIDNDITTMTAEQLYDKPIKMYPALGRGSTLMYKGIMLTEEQEKRLYEYLDETVGWE